MTGKEFENTIIQNGQPLRISDQVVISKIDLQKKLTAIGVVIENCTFEELVIFENVDLNCGIKFKNCHFKKQFAINNCNAKNHDMKFNFDNYHLEFINTTVEGLFFNGINEIQRGVTIKDHSVINRLSVNTLISDHGTFSINDSTVNSQFDISQAKLTNGVSIRGDSVINAKIRFENIEVDSISFTDAAFNKDVHIWAGKVGNLTFNDGIFKDDISITGVPISSHLTIIGTQFNKSIIFNLWDETNKKKGNLSKIYISSGKFGEQFIVNGNNFTIDDLILNTSKQLEGAIYFNSTNILNTKISGDNYNSNIVFNHSNFNNLNFDFFYNYSTLSILSAKSFGETSNITIAHSNLGKTQLFNVFLNSFNKIHIYNSVITEIITANIKWFSDHRLNPEISGSDHSHEQRKEIYRQLKYAVEKQGNRIESLRFKALEMKSFKKESFVKVSWYKRIFSTDRFVLWVGQTNNFGLNWWKPILFAIGFSLLFHFMIVVGISKELTFSPNLHIQSIELTWKIYKANLSSLPQLMNPAHLLDRTFPNTSNLNFTVHLLDYGLKIILAFFIFQTVSAFRKYIK